MKRLSPVVIALGWVSLFSDVSSEMIFPLLPVFLSSVLGAGPAALGMIEGLAESTAALMKLLSGYLADRYRNRRVLMLGGYGMASIARPLIGFAKAWPQVMALRFFDRIGKGLRTSPRDALIADETPVSHRGRAYGFNRSMDHAGALIGPLLAALLLSQAHWSLREVFRAAALPAALCMAVLWFGTRRVDPHEQKSAHAAPLRLQLSALTPPFRKFLLGMGVFTLGNSSDAFLLAWLHRKGLSATTVTLLWSAHHAVKMTSSVAGGRLADKMSPRLLIAVGWVLFAAVYAVFGWSDSIPVLIATFLVYGFYFGLTEPAEKVLVAQTMPAAVRGQAFGWYHAIVGITALPASLLFGVLAEHFGSPAAFLTGAALALAASAWVFGLRETR